MSAEVSKNNTATGGVEGGAFSDRQPRGWALLDGRQGSNIQQ